MLEIEIVASKERGILERKTQKINQRLKSGGAKVQKQCQERKKNEDNVTSTTNFGQNTEYNKREIVSSFVRNKRRKKSEGEQSTRDICYNLERIKAQCD